MEQKGSVLFQTLREITNSMHCRITQALTLACLCVLAPSVGAQQGSDRVVTQRQLMIQPECFLGGPKLDRLFVHSAIDMTYEHVSAPKELVKYLKRAFKEGKGRILWSIECSLKTSECSGVQVDLTPSEFGEPIKGSDVVTMKGARVTSRTNSFFVIEWGFHVLTVDLKSRKVNVRYDTTQVAGNGVGVCNPS